VSYFRFKTPFGCRPHFWRNPGLSPESGDRRRSPYSQKHPTSLWRCHRTGTV